MISKISSYEEGEEYPTLSGFLEEVALIADIDDMDDKSQRVVLMTLHSAKGLEFPYVYLAGMEDGLFPSYMSIATENADTEIEEERRLAYVGITRAMENLTITCARARMIRGEMQFNRISRFVKEIPPQLLAGSTYEPKSKEMPTSDDAYKRAKTTFRTQATTYPPVSNQRDFGTPATGNTALGYEVGDRVRHIKFGDGQVAAIVAGGRDYEVTVDFDKVGTKKMFASFAKLKKL